MSEHASASRRAFPLVGLAVFVAALGSIVMADTHVPVAIEPDAARAGGASVATFALG